MSPTATDLAVLCADCSEDFVFTIAEQRFYAERGIRQPVRCQPCRAARRAERNAALIAAHESSGNAGTWSEMQQAVAGYGLTAAPAKGRGGARPTMYHGVCADCGKDTEVPFNPRPGRPVYCRACFASRKGR
jgi:CxxC-x17-CxxC domain-containing protein